MGKVEALEKKVEQRDRTIGKLRSELKKMGKCLYKCRACGRRTPTPHTIGPGIVTCGNKSCILAEARKIKGN